MKNYMNKNKKVLIVLGIIGLLIILATILFVIFKKNKMITINFDTSGGDQIQSIEIEQGDSINLPNITRDGFTFLGWYIGDILVSNKTKFAANTTIFAKWLDESIKTYTITFDTDGGSFVNDLIVECDKEIKFGPNPTKTGFEFVSWIDENETPIVDGALLECKNITLKANWKQDDVVEENIETKTETKTTNKKGTAKKTVYSCSEGTLEGDKCVIESDVKKGCKDDYTLMNETCVSTSSYQSAKKCPSKKLDKTYEGVYIEVSGTNYCGYHELNTNECDESKKLNSKCYEVVESISNPLNECSSGYTYIASQNNKDGCYLTSNTIDICDESYELSDNKCLKRIDAIVSYK